MLTFAVGVMTQNWPLAFTGIVYSTLTAAAMWQNLRQRLPYLYDPWSEPMPTAPSLMHAMIGISTMIEIGAVFAGIAQAVKAGATGWSPLLFGLSGVMVCAGMLRFLGRRGVSLRDIIRWERPNRLAVWCLGAIAAGGLLGALGHGYQELLRLIPYTAELLGKAEEQAAQHPEMALSYSLLAVCIVPFTEELMFRGLLYRALDREWGGWRAVAGSAMFFAIYHPPLAWIPVWLVGAANALLFRKSGWLIPCVLLHMAYNGTLFLLAH